MRRMLILNLTRMGDLIQTTPVLIGLKEKDPSSHATLVVSEAFKGICPFIPGVDDVVSFPMGKLGELLGRGEIVQAYREALGVLERINAREYDIALNFTHSRVSAFLITLVRAKEVGGFRIDDEGASYIEKDWHRFFFNIVSSRPFSPFHICDLHLFMAGLGPCGEGVHLDVTSEKKERARRFLEEAGVPTGRPLVGIHPGASEAKRTWGIENFARLAELIARETGAGVLLFGSKGEKDACDRIEEMVRERVYNFGGKTTLGELVPLISFCDLFVSNDTGPLHIATAVGTKSIGIFLKTAYFRQTGPYGKDHYVVEPLIPCHPCRFGTDCSHLSCRDYIPVEGIYEIASKLLMGGELETLPDAGNFSKMQVYRSFFDPGDGAIDYQPLVERPISEKDLLTYLYRYVFMNSFGRPEEGFRILTPQWLVDKLASFYDLSTLGPVIEEFRENQRALEWMCEMTGEARDIVDGIVGELREAKPNFEKIDRALGRLKEIDHQVIERGTAFHQLVPLVRLFRLEKEAVVDRDPLEAAGRTREVYERFLSRSAVFQELLERLKKLCESSGFSSAVR